MMRIIFGTVFLAALLFSTGCSQYWYQDGKSFSQCKHDCRDCRIEADKYSDSDQRLSDYKTKFEKRCMKERGYRLKNENSLPLKARRRPADILYGEYYGIAGCLNNEPDDTKN